MSDRCKDDLGVRPRVYTCFVLVSFLAAAWCNAADPTQPTSALRCTVLDVHDADTLKVIIHLPFDVDLRDKSIRAWGYDAWEVSRVRQTVDVTDEEIAKGKTARDALKKMLEEHVLYVEDSGHRDPYGRVSGVLWLRASDGSWTYVPAWMESKGHLRTKR